MVAGVVLSHSCHVRRGRGRTGPVCGRYIPGSSPAVGLGGAAHKLPEHDAISGVPGRPPSRMSISVWRASGGARQPDNVQVVLGPAHQTGWGQPCHQEYP